MARKHKAKEEVYTEQYWVKYQYQNIDGFYVTKTEEINHDVTHLMGHFDGKAEAKNQHEAVKRNFINNNRHLNNMKVISVTYC